MLGSAYLEAAKLAKLFPDLIVFDNTDGNCVEIHFTRDPHNGIHIEGLGGDEAVLVDLEYKKVVGIVFAKGDYRR